MSGRARHLRDGVWITNRKTARRQSPRRPLLERLHDLNARQARRDPGYDVRIGFLLPPELGGFVASGPHGGGVHVLKDFVQISGVSAEQCFQRAANFFAVVAKDRAFTRRASIISLKRPGEHYGRHLTVAGGTLMVCGGYVEPKIFHARAT
jgi:hypothetical protein